MIQQIDKIYKVIDKRYKFPYLYIVSLQQIKIKK